MSYSLDVELFIREIEKRPVIWDLNHEDNRHKNRKQNAWEEVARKFIQDFDDMTKVEQFDVYRKLFGKWRNIRDSYVRDMKKKPGQKRYMYLKHLGFLGNLYNKQNENTLTDEDEWSEGDMKKLSESDKYNNEEEIWQVSDELPIEDSRRKRLKKEENPLEYLDTPLLGDTTCNFPVPVEDEDRSFFDSLLPAVRSFDIDQKLEFRSDVINLLKRYRKGQRNKNPSSDNCDE